MNTDKHGFIDSFLDFIRVHLRLSEFPLPFLIEVLISLALGRRRGR
jgi:hypothetical protein